jgi:hypothetical protein
MRKCCEGSSMGMGVSFFAGNDAALDSTPRIELTGKVESQAWEMIAVQRDQPDLILVASLVATPPAKKHASAPNSHPRCPLLATPCCPLPALHSSAHNRPPVMPVQVAVRYSCC